ncbi:MAG: hypothetical protein JWO58_2011 [Chitinophagaceae bacterium]|nr:hypothetical protein [Chitinophagaceae bacterium]
MASAEKKNQVQSTAVVVQFFDLGERASEDMLW